MADGQTADPSANEPAESPDRASAVAAHTALPVVSVAVLALLVHLCTSFGMLYVAPIITCPLVVGAITALVARRSWWVSMVGVTLGLALAMVWARPWFLGDLSADPAAGILVSVLFVALGSVTAGAVSLALGRSALGGKAEWRASAGVVLTLIAGLWSTTVSVDFSAHGEQPLMQYLSGRPVLGANQTDADLFLQLFYDTHAGKPYYDVYAKHFIENPQMEYHYPVGVTGYRLPTLYYVWLLLPADGSTLVWAFLVVASLAIASAFLIGAFLCRPGAATFGALLIAVAHTYIATTKYVTFSDGWAMAAVLVGVALLVASALRGSRGLLWASVAVLLFAAALREFLVYVMVFGAASALVASRDRRWRETWPWLVGLAAFGGLYVAHVVAIAGRLAPSRGAQEWLNGGPGHVMAMLEFYSRYLGGAPWLVPVLVAAGIAGAVLLRRCHDRLATFFLLSTAVPLAVLLFLGNAGHRTLVWPTTIDYWGMLVVPLALTLVPITVGRALDALRSRGEVPARPRPSSQTRRLRHAPPRSVRARRQGVRL